MGEVVKFKAKVLEVQEKPDGEIPLPDDNAILAFANVLLYLRALSTSDTATVKISDEDLIFEVKHYMETEDGEMEVNSGTIMTQTSVGEIANEEGTPYEGDVLRDIVKEMFRKVQL